MEKTTGQTRSLSPNHFSNLTSSITILSCFVVLRAAHADTRNNYSLALNGYAWGNPYTSYFNYDSDSGFSGVNLSATNDRWRADAGNVSLNYNDLGFGGRSFEGIRLAIPIDKTEVTLLGGRTVYQPDIIDPAIPFFLRRDQISTPVYGVRLSHALNDRLSLQASELLTPDSPREQGRNIHSAGVRYLVNKKSAVLLEAAQSSHGSGLQFSSLTQGKRLFLRTLVRSANNGFSSAGNSDLIAFRNGYEADARYKLSDRVSLSGATQDYDDGFEARYRSHYGQVQFQANKRASVGLSYQMRSDIKAPLLGFRTASSVRTSGPGIFLNYRLKRANVSLRYEQLKYSYPMSALQNSKSNRVSLGLTQQVGSRTSLSLYHSFDTNKQSNAALDSNSASTSVYVYHRVNNQGLGLQAGMQHQKSSSTLFSGDTTSLIAGFDYPAGRYGNIGITYQFQASGNGSLSTVSPNQLTLRYSRSLDFGKRPSRTEREGYNLPVEERRLLGQLTGRVFDDRNLNGKWDIGEAGVSDINFTLPGSGETSSDGKGLFAVKSLRPGNYALGLVTKTIPIEYSILVPATTDVIVPPSGTVQVDFPVVRAGNISGVVFEDKNRDGVRDEGERGIPDIAVSVEGGEVVGFSDENGKYTLYNLSPKEWKVVPDLSVLGNDLIQFELAGSDSPVVKVLPESVVGDVNLGVIEKDRPVVFTSKEEIARTAKKATPPASEVAKPSSKEAPALETSTEAKEQDAKKQPLHPVSYTERKPVRGIIAQPVSPPRKAAPVAQKPVPTSMLPPELGNRNLS
ncbi:MAG TPA: SdrD B-like domain-containing protein [Abditibacteriaceae bacterium]|jgi:hypothetical protein